MGDEDEVEDLICKNKTETLIQLQFPLKVELVRMLQYTRFQTINLAQNQERWRAADAGWGEQYDFPTKNVYPRSGVLSRTAW